MSTKWPSEKDVEALLTRQEPEDITMSDLARRLGALDPSRINVDAGRATDFATAAAPLARSGSVSQKAATARRRRGLSLTPRLATAAVAAFLVLGTAGAAAASDSAAPGNVLYGLDLALEDIGIGAGGVPERVDEAGVLLQRGDAAAALSHIADAVHPRSEAAAEALQAAADRLRSNQGGSDNAKSVRAGVAEMLEWMASSELHGREFGQSVADRARNLGNGSKSESGADSEGKGKEDAPGQSKPKDKEKGNGPPGGSPPGRDR